MFHIFRDLAHKTIFNLAENSSQQHLKINQTHLYFEEASLSCRRFLKIWMRSLVRPLEVLFINAQKRLYRKWALCLNFIRDFGEGGEYLLGQCNGCLNMKLYFESIEEVLWRKSVDSKYLYHKISIVEEINTHSSERNDIIPMQRFKK